MGQLEQGRKLDEFWDEAKGFHLQRMIAPNKSVRVSRGSFLDH